MNVFVVYGSYIFLLLLYSNIDVSAYVIIDINAYVHIDISADVCIDFNADVNIDNNVFVHIDINAYVYIDFIACCVLFHYGFGRLVRSNFNCLLFFWLISKHH